MKIRKAFEMMSLFGCKIRRKKWSKDLYLYQDSACDYYPTLYANEVTQTMYTLPIKDVLADDWEVLQ